MVVCFIYAFNQHQQIQKIWGTHSSFYSKLGPEVQATLKMIYL